MLALSGDVTRCFRLHAIKLSSDKVIVTALFNKMLENLTLLVIRLLDKVMNLPVTMK